MSIGVQILIAGILTSLIDCSTNENNPTLVYVKEGDEAVLQCGAAIVQMEWYISSGNTADPWRLITSESLTIDDNKYNTSKNQDGLYYRLHVRNVGASDLVKYKCLAGSSLTFYYYRLQYLALPTSVTIENLQGNKLVGTQDQNLLISCVAVGGSPAPTVTLDIDGTTVGSGTQSVQYTVTSINRSYDRKTVTCKASHTEYGVFTLNVTEMIYLNLKPLKPSITPENLSTEETKPLTVVCTSTGSRPYNTVVWTIDRKDITSHASPNVQHITANDTYTVTSTLRYSVDRSDNNKVISCKALNVAAPNGVQTMKPIVVKYSPVVTVANVTFNQSDNPRSIKCIANGNPTTYTYSKWQHRSKYGKVLRSLNGDQNGVLTLLDVGESERYKDSGEYTCTVSNGIKDYGGNITQSGSGYVLVKAEPVFTADNTEQIVYGNIGEDVSIHVFVYSIPKYNQPTWYKGASMIIPSAKYSMSEIPAIVNDTQYGANVQLDGYRTTLLINDLQETDFAYTYSLHLGNGVGQTVKHDVLLLERGAPQMPQKVSVHSITATTVVVMWIPGYNGGSNQQFYIQYRQLNTTKIWHVVKVLHTVDHSEILFFILTKLQQNTMYELRMYSENKYNKSSFTDTKVTRTAVMEKDNQCYISRDLFGGVVGSLVVIIIIILCIVVVKYMVIPKLLTMENTGTRKKSENMPYQDLTNLSTYEEVHDDKGQRSKAQDAFSSTCSGGTPIDTYEMMGEKTSKVTYDHLKEKKGKQDQINPLNKQPLDEQKQNMYETIEKVQDTEKEYTNTMV